MSSKIPKKINRQLKRMKREYIKPASVVLLLATEDTLLSTSPGLKDELGGDQLSNQKDFDWGSSQWNEAASDEVMMGE